MQNDTEARRAAASALMRIKVGIPYETVDLQQNKRFYFCVKINETNVKKMYQTTYELTRRLIAVEMAGDYASTGKFDINKYEHIAGVTWCQPVACNESLKQLKTFVKNVIDENKLIIETIADTLIQFDPLSYHQVGKIIEQTYNQPDWLLV